MVTVGFRSPDPRHSGDVGHNTTPTALGDQGRGVRLWAIRLPVSADAGQLLGEPSREVRVVWVVSRGEPMSRRGRDR